MTENPEMSFHWQLVSSHGMLAILEVLEGMCSRDVLMKLLHIINLVRYLDQEVMAIDQPFDSSLQVTSACWRVFVLLVEFL
jgi:hypothetical protein